jgi:thymidylate kinase
LKRGKLVVFSGLDGAGKSTQIERLRARLREGGVEPVYVWSRGGYTPGFAALKGALRRLSRGRAVPPSGHSAQRAQALGRGRTRRLWLRLALLDLIWLYGVRVRWWRARGQTVICDRYLGDTLIDFTLNFPQENVAAWPLWRLLERVAPRPDAAFLMLIPVAESQRRAALKNEPFPDAPEVLEQRLRHYQAQAAAGHWQTLDGLRSIDDLAAEIWGVVSG